MKEQITELVNRINQLDINSDTIMMIDWSSRNIILNQGSNNIILNSLWSLIHNPRQKGRSLYVISSEKLTSIREYLILYLNDTEKNLIVPESEGFSVLSYTDMLFKGHYSTAWVSRIKINFKNSWYLKMYLYLTSKTYRNVREILRDVDFK